MFCDAADFCFIMVLLDCGHNEHNSGVLLTLAVEVHKQNSQHTQSKIAVTKK